MEPRERLARAASRELARRLIGAPAREHGKVAEAAMRPPDPGQAFAQAKDDLAALEDLARRVVDTVLELGGRDLDPVAMRRAVLAAAKEHLALRASGSGQAGEVTAPLEAELPRLINLPRLASLAQGAARLEPGVKRPSTQAMPEIVGTRSPAFNQVLKDLERVAQTDLPVMLVGETGTGKELLARRLHLSSLRREGPLVPVNCAALPANLLEAELFGHEKGAFTGAATAREGLIQAAHGGTLFLDEIGETTPEFQVRLLRVLEDQMVTPLGARQGRRVDFRLVSATHRDLEEAARGGEFNPALLYRVLVVPLKLPPLRERREDLPELMEHFMTQAGLAAARTRRLTPETIQALMDYSWPGNVRQLGHLLQRLVALSPEFEIGPDMLPPEVRSAAQCRGSSDLTYRLRQAQGVPGHHVEGLARLLAQAGEEGLTNREVREALGCSDSTAKNLLRALVSAGMLEAQGRRGGRRYLLNLSEED